MIHIRPLTALSMILTLCVLGAGCSRRGGHSGTSEAKITGSPTDPPVELHAEWQVDHQYDLVLQFEQYTQVRNRNTDDDFDQDIKFKLAFNGQVKPDVSPKASSNLWLNLDLNGLMFSLIRGDTPLIHFDTRSQVGRLEDDQRTTDALEKLVGSKWSYTVAADGAVLSASVDTNTPSARALNPDVKIMGLTVVKRLFNPQYFRPFLEVSGLPAEAVKVGATWPVERYFNAGTVGTVQFNGHCVFRGWQTHAGKRCARLDLSGDLKPAMRLPGRLGKLLKGSSELEKGTLTGQIWYDPEQKLPVQSVTDLTMSTVLYQRSKSPATRAAIAATNSVSGGTNGPPPTKLSVPLSQRITLRISDLGAAPAVTPSGQPKPAGNP